MANYWGNPLFVSVRTTWRFAPAGHLNPMTYGAVAILLAGVAVGASWLPARRAAGLDPVKALRAD